MGSRSGKPWTWRQISCRPGPREAPGSLPAEPRERATNTGDCKARGVAVHVAQAGNAALHVVARSERSHNCAGHSLLDSRELHTAFLSNAEARNLLALSASSWTSSKEGMLSSHSSSVAVWPTRWMARS